VKNDADAPRVVVSRKGRLRSLETCANKIGGKSRSPFKETRDYDNSIKDLRPVVETLAVVSDHRRRRKETYKG